MTSQDYNSRIIVWEENDFNPDKYIRELIKEKETFEEEDRDLLGKTFFNGPFGIESAIDPFGFTKNFKFIIAHCSFNISDSLYKRIVTTKGVDFFKLLSRYRFIISVGKAFDPKNVMTEIEDRVYANQEHSDVPEVVQTLMDQLDEFCCYISANDELHLTTPEDDNYTSKIEVFKESQEKYGGRIFRHPD